jgi:GH24 family phage-related lysozyme (muramidase)
MILSEEKLNKIDNYLNEAISLLTEVEELDDRTFVWDLAKERVDKSAEEIENKSQAEEYLRNVLRKIKSVPEKIKVKLAKYAISLLLGFTAISSISNIINDEAPEIKNQLSFSIPELREEPKEEVEALETPSSSSQWLYDFLKDEEGYRNKGYKIGDGKITIGWGHAEDRRNSKYKVGQEISKSEAEELLRQDVATAEDAVNNVLRKWDDEGIIYKIDQNMYDAMVSIAYNRGRGAFRRSDFIQLVKQGKYLEAQDEILKMNKRAYRKYPGLKKRREKEAEKFGENLYKMIALLNNEKKDDMISESYKSRLKNLAGII